MVWLIKVLFTIIISGDPFSTFPIAQIAVPHDAELATKGVEDILEGISDRTEESVKDVFKAVERNLEGQREAQGETIEEE